MKKPRENNKNKFFKKLAGFALHDEWFFREQYQDLKTDEKGKFLDYMIYKVFDLKTISNVLKFIKQN